MKSYKERKEKLSLVKEALKERSYFIENANYMNKYIPIIVPCENVFLALYYFFGVFLFNLDGLILNDLLFIKRLKIIKYMSSSLYNRLIRAKINISKFEKLI